MLYYFVVSVYVIVCLFLIVVVLLQQGRAGDIASAFGGSSSQTVFGARSGATILTRATEAAAVLFMVGSVALAILWQKGPTSVVSGTKAPAAQTLPAAPAKSPVTTPAPAPAPAQTAPAQPVPAPKK